jgi:hypothetical protein
MCWKNGALRWMSQSSAEQFLAPIQTQSRKRSMSFQECLTLLYYVLLQEQSGRNYVPWTWPRHKKTILLDTGIALLHLTAICEAIVHKMWEPRRLTALWASTACYRDSFT